MTADTYGGREKGACLVREEFEAERGSGMPWLTRRRDRCTGNEKIAALALVWRK